MFEHKDQAWMAGFKDGFLGVWGRPVLNFHSQYEKGFILGCCEKRQRERDNTKLP
jgi:hypothetical protein